MEPSNQTSDRIIRALTHRLSLLHRPDPSSFFILGATGNVYKVTISSTTTTPSCTCPDRAVPCKHILFVLLRVLNLPLHHPFHVASVPEAGPTSADVMAGSRARERFHQIYSASSSSFSMNAHVHAAREGEVCPVCLEEMREEDGERLVTCGTCGNSLHGECLMRWKRSRGRRAASCVVCRARWRDRRREQERYVNLEAYVSDADDVAERGHCAR